MSNNVRKLSRIQDVWPPFKVQKTDIQEAIDYATISLPWTFDRLRYGPKTQKAVNARLLHILIGVLNQTILERVLTGKGYVCSADWTKYRESDVFDFKISGKTYDVKTVVIYKQYNETLKRENFSIELLLSNKDYGGPEWRHFFPMMVAVSQLTLDKMKDSYIFGIAETYEDLLKRDAGKSSGGFWCAAPYGKAHDFFHTTGLIRQRECCGKGFRINVSWKSKQRKLFGNGKRKVKLTLFGEWAGDRQTETLRLIERKAVVSQSEFSSLSCVRLEHPSVLADDDEIAITVKPHFTDFFPKLTNPSINLNDPQFEWVLQRDSFVNLQVPEDYKVYWIGHISFQEFAQRFASYDSYFIPYGNNMDINQPGRVNAESRKKLELLDKRRQKAIEQGVNVPWPAFLPLIDNKNQIRAGMLLAAMRGLRPIGAACYFYPPYALLESAIYVLPSDLYNMDSLPRTGS
jgi:hypothetical protein